MCLRRCDSPGQKVESLIGFIEKKPTFLSGVLWIATSIDRWRNRASINALTPSDFSYMVHNTYEKDYGR